MSAKDDSELCVLCKKEVKSTEIVFVCGLWCKKFFHNKCVGLSDIEARALMYKNKRVKFHCEACEMRLGIERFGGKDTDQPRILEKCVNNSINVVELVQNLLKLTSDLSNNNSEINKKLDRVLTSNSRLEEYLLQSSRRFGERNEETSNNVVEGDESDSTNKITEIHEQNGDVNSHETDKSSKHVDSDFTEHLTDSQKQNDAEGYSSNHLQEWEVSGGHNSVRDPLSIPKQECSSSEEFPLSFTDSIAKTEAIQDKDIEDDDIVEINDYKEECSPSEEFPLSFTDSIPKTEAIEDKDIEDDDIVEINDYKGELKQDVEFTNSDNEPESTRTAAMVSTAANKMERQSVGLSGRAVCGAPVTVCKAAAVSITLAAETHNSIQCSSTQETSHLGPRCDIRKKTQDLKQIKRTGEVCYSCNVCSKTFINHSRLKRHYLQHSDERPYTCDVCNKAFKHSTHLKHHIRSHSGECPYSCDVCNKKFALKSSLYRHFRIHTGERPYSCHVCNKRFKQSSNVKEHLRIHTGERPYCCNVCKLRFRQISTVKDHLRIHTGERPYCCNVCNKTFTQRQSLNQHIRQHTEDDPIPV